MELIFATHNPHKLQEIQQLLGDTFHLISLSDLNFRDEIPETRDTLEGNALEKARFIFSRFHQGIFADDTGLEVQSLHGAPGVYSARYAGPLSQFENEADRSKANIFKLLEALKDKDDRTARFKTVIAFINPEGEEFLFDGTVNGKIINELRGKEGFGYDPVFLPDDHDQTFAEMSLDAKNKISHRARAFAKFNNFLKGED